MRENRNVPFRDWNIRVSRNHNGQLHICAVDICDILKRDERVSGFSWLVSFLLSV